MSSPDEQVSIPDVEVKLPDLDDLSYRTACCCVHCSCFCPNCMRDGPAPLASCNTKLGCLCLSFLQSCDVCRKHSTCASNVGKSYCFDMTKDYKGEAGWFHSQTAGKSLCCLQHKQQAHCAKTPLPLLKCAAQESCCDVRCALPFDDEVPMQIAFAGKVLYAPKQSKMVVVK